MKRTLWIPVFITLTLCCLFSCKSSPDYIASVEDIDIKADFTIDSYLNNSDLHNHETQLFARNGHLLYILQRGYSGSRIIVLNLIDNSIETGIDLVIGDRFSGVDSVRGIVWSDSIQKLICMDVSGTIVLLDPGNNYSQEIIEFEQKLFPGKLAIQGDLLLVSHTSESRIDAFDLRDSTVRFKHSYINVGSNFVFLDERYCLTSYGSLYLLDLETGVKTDLITMSTSGEYSDISCLEYDQESRTAYFSNSGFIYAYRADSDTVPAHSTTIDNNNNTLRINAGVLYRLDPDYYAYDKYNNGIKSRNGILSILSTDRKEESIRLSRSTPFLQDSVGKVNLIDDPSKARATFALIRTESGHSPALETGGAFARALLYTPHYLEQIYVLSFYGTSIPELTERLAQDENLRQACAGIFNVYTAPGDRIYALIDKPSTYPHELSAIEAVLFPSNPWDERSSYILVIKQLTEDSQKVDLETTSITTHLYAQELPSMFLNPDGNILTARIPLWSNPAEPEAEATRLRNHLAQEYPEFISLELLEE